MGIFDFVMQAGQKLLGRDDAPEAPTSAPAAAAPAAPRTSAGTLHLHLKKLGLAPDDLSVGFDDGTVTVKGTAASKDDRGKIVVALGNVQGVGRVDDQMTVAGADPEPTFYTVQSGDSLSKIAKEQYGDATKYPVIFEANTPMLEHPDKIYPGQVLRIPPLGD